MVADPPVKQLTISHCDIHRYSQHNYDKVHSADVMKTQNLHHKLDDFDDQ